MRKYGLFFVGFVSLVSAAMAQNIIQLPDSLRAVTDTVKWVKRIPMYCEGPAWEPATGAVYFTEQFASGVANWPIWKVIPGNAADTGMIFVNTYQNNGLDFDPQGRLVSCQNGRLSRYNGNGTLDSTLVVSPSNGVTFGMANDLSIGLNGAIYFTALGNAVYYLSPTRQLSTATTNISSANGIEWMESENAVYVNSTSGGAVYKFAIGTNGALGTRTNYVSVTSPDGGTYDSHGNRYVGSYSLGEIRVFNARGDSIGRIALRTATGTYDNRAGNTGNVDNCVFGGADLKTLYITGDGGLYSILLKIPGQARYGTTAIKNYRLQSLNRTDAGIFLNVRGQRLFLTNSKVNFRNIPALRWK